MYLIEYAYFGPYGPKMSQIISGIYHSFTGGKQKTIDEYLRGGQTITLLPAVLSLSVSFVSSVAMLGLAAEIYTFGGQFWLSTISWPLGHILSVLIYVPVLYPLRTTTANEVYLFLLSLIYATAFLLRFELF